MRRSASTYLAATAEQMGRAAATQDAPGKKKKKSPECLNMKPATDSTDTEAAVTMLNLVDGESNLT